MSIFAQHEESSTSNWSGGGMVDAKIGKWGIVLIAPICIPGTTGSSPVLTTRMFHPCQIIGMTDGKTSNCLHSSTDRILIYGIRDRGSNPLGGTKKSLIVISKVCNDINIVG